MNGEVPAHSNPRYTLRAYETADCARLASILIDLSGLLNPHNMIVLRDSVAEEWVRRYPWHQVDTGRGRVRARVTNSLSLLKAAGVAHTHGSFVVIDNIALLRMVANNLSILVGADGRSLPPSQWKTRPACPADLRPAQDELEARRRA